MAFLQGSESLERKATVWVDDEHASECCRCLSLLSIREQQLPQKLLEWLSGPRGAVLELHLIRRCNCLTDTRNSGSMLPVSKLNRTVERSRKRPCLRQLV